MQKNKFGRRLGEGGYPSGKAILDALIENGKGLPPVWIIPLVVLLISLWLGYKTLSEEGATITIIFTEAPGLEAGKSKVKYKDVDVGVITDVQLSKDLKTVKVTAKMEKSISSHLGAKSVFWVVKPQMGLNGISGLDALTAGNYVGVEFDDGPEVHEFLGRDRAPTVTANTPGRSFTLMAETATSLSYGTPIFFRDIQVGQVISVALDHDGHGVRSDVFIDAPYDGLIHDDTRFWKVSGLSFSMGAQGVNVSVGSLASILTGGGITFETPSLLDADSTPSAPGMQFRLHKDHDAIIEGSYKVRNPFLLYFDDSVRGLAIGAPVEFKGIEVGRVLDIQLDFNLQSQKVRIPVLIEVDIDRMFPAKHEAELEEFIKQHQAEIAAGRHPMIEKLVERGLRARLKTGSMLTGQMYVDVDFYPDVPKQHLIYNDQYPELPTLPSIADELQRNVMDIVTGLKKIPLDKIGMELLGTVQGSNQLLNSKDLKESVRALNLAVQEVHQIAKTADQELVTLSRSLEKNLSSSSKILEQMEPGAPMAVDLATALEELASSARSIRALTDYLERHPESLVQGKNQNGGKP
jgi:paraquat-inducible protein B